MHPLSLILLVSFHFGDQGGLLSPMSLMFPYVQFDGKAVFGHDPIAALGIGIHSSQQLKELFEVCDGREQLILRRTAVRIEVREETCFCDVSLPIFKDYAKPVPKALFNRTRSLLLSIRYEKCFKANS